LAGCPPSWRSAFPDLPAVRAGGYAAGVIAPRDAADLGDYQPLATVATAPLRDVDRATAERAHAQLLAARPARHGVELDADHAPLAVGRWLVAAGAAAGPAALTGADAHRWHGLAVDVALWLGERIIARAASAGGGLRWELYTGVKKATGYQRAVLTGFRRVDDARYYVDVAHFVAAWLELALRRRPARPDFLAVIEASALADA
jgi:hypothetical protein